MHSLPDVKVGSSNVDFPFPFLSVHASVIMNLSFSSNLINVYIQKFENR